MRMHLGFARDRQDSIQAIALFERFGCILEEA